MTRRSGSETTVSSKMSRPPIRTAKGAQLHVIHPPELAATLMVGRDRTVLGREAEEATALLDHPTVSRRHLAIEWDDTVGRHVASDLGSRNGSRVDGKPVADRQPLGDGAVVRVGDVVGVYELGRAGGPGDAPGVSLDSIPGEAAATRLLRLSIARAAPDPSPILLIGETGTGKEWIAKEIHRLSGRTGPLLAINCAALSPQLVESQLFGHVKGAFTGALANQAGLFRSASGGSIFLDEIGELAAELQPKLLRTLQESEVHPVGATHPERVDVRVIAATNQDIGEQSRSGRFRRDLYARLSLWEVRVPSLRERRADIVSWLDRLVERWHERRPQSDALPFQLDSDAVEALLLQRFPLNLRDLDRLVHALAVSGRRPIGEADIRAVLDDHPAQPVSPESPAAAGVDDQRKRAPTREELEGALRDSKGNVRALARRFGRDRRQIYRWVEAFGLGALLGESRED